MHISPMPFPCIRNECSNAPSTTSALPAIRFCSAAVPELKLVGSTVRPSCSKYLRFSATKYATLFIWLTEPPTDSAMRVFSSLGACARTASLVANTRVPASASMAARFIEILPRFLLAWSVSGEGRAHKRPARGSRGPTLRGFACDGLARFRGQHAHAALHLGGHPVVAHELTRIAQTDRLALHHEQPQRMPGFRHQGAPL